MKYKGKMKFEFTVDVKGEADDMTLNELKYELSKEVLRSLKDYIGGYSCCSTKFYLDYHISSIKRIKE